PGVSTGYGIVKQSEGYIWVESEPGVGTTFMIYLPRVDAVEAPDADPWPESAAPALRGGSATVLRVDSAAPHALRAAAAHAGHIHLIVTDLIMPGMTGRSTAEEIATARPEMRVLYISGHSDEAVTRRGILSPGSVFLGKPFTPEGLLRKVRELLDGPG